MCVVVCDRAFVEGIAVLSCVSAWGTSSLFYPAFVFSVCVFCRGWDSFVLWWVYGERVCAAFTVPFVEVEGPGVGYVLVFTRV